jgi:hypothetical protein
VSGSFGTLGAEALESRYRRLCSVLGALSFTESWCGRLHGARGVTGSSELGASRALIVRRSRGSRSSIREGSRARAGRRSRRRDGQILGCERAGGGMSRPAAAATSSKTGAGNAMSVCTWGTRDSGPEITWRSSKPEEGSDRGRGLTAALATRDSAWRKASKSRRLDRGSRFIGERARSQRHGGSSSRRGRVAV